MSVRSGVAIETQDEVRQVKKTFSVEIRHSKQINVKNNTEKERERERGGVEAELQTEKKEETKHTNRASY